MTDAEAAAVLRTLDADDVLNGQPSAWLRDWVVFGLGTRLRPGEQRGLRRSDARLAEGAVLRRRAEARTGEGTPSVHGRPGRGGQRPPPVEAVAGARRIGRGAEERDGLLASAQLRHVDGGVPLLDLARTMGTSAQMIERHYGHYDPARGASHVARVFGTTGGAATCQESPGEAVQNPA